MCPHTSLYMIDDIHFTNKEILQFTLEMCQKITRWLVGSMIINNIELEMGVSLTVCPSH